LEDPDQGDIGDDLIEQGQSRSEVSVLVRQERGAVVRRR
jgi:hypothetical protein